MRRTVCYGRDTSIRLTAARKSLGPSIVVLHRFSNKSSLWAFNSPDAHRVAGYIHKLAFSLAPFSASQKSGASGSGGGRHKLTVGPPGINDHDVSQVNTALA